jgi:hypothetical protein
MLTSRDALGRRDPNIENCILAMPFIGARVFQHLIPETNGLAIYFGAAIGMGATILIGSTPIGYATGGLAGGIAASTIAAATVRVLRQE